MMTNPSKYNGIRYSNTVPKSVLEQLEIFKNKLEKAYFSGVLIRVLKNTQDRLEIGVEFQSNFWLSEGVCYYNNSNWLKDKLDINSSRLEEFYSSLESLRYNTEQFVDIAELAIYLTDTSIIVSKVCENSIVNSLDAILDTLVTNIDNLMTEKLELPTEIHLPLLPEDKIDLTNITEKSYFGFWGLYYESEEDAVIYDVSNNTTNKGDLFMVDHI
ncbi:hypothetical protein M4I21_02910 [Cellulophaga sp. 20_2_10]|uniref:hypothetical protein n=1 Tax=Cellulophaga sp. 20_2_10 TaxID=2942476 RepID=UPI00201A9D21|nr:hypothetical protein [Cellulophaga sp. 20_2_10]MCL5244742.1 hypothetical protein [Cellulophaga sp. 20_2_10]